MSVIGGVALRVYEDNSLGVLGNIPLPIYFVDAADKATGIPIRIELIVLGADEKAIPPDSAIPVYLVADPDEKVVGNAAIRVYDINA